MSRSYKHQPFLAVCGCGKSAKQDKLYAHRGERRKHKYLIQKHQKFDDFEDFLLPIREECPHNNVWGWNRDGKQTYQKLDSYSWQLYLESESPDDYFGQWPPLWYVQMWRK